MLTTIEKPAVQARREIATVLRRYRLAWDEVAPDRDNLIWKRSNRWLKSS